MDLLREWAGWRVAGPPYVLAADRPVIESRRSARAITVRTGWSSVYRAPDFLEPGDHRLHLGLLPQPFWGDLRRASIYVLMLNPHIGPTDYYAEFEVAAYRRALIANLRQRFPKSRPPFLFLDPAFSWHGGFAWWHSKLAGVITRLASLWDIPFAEARHRLAQSLASIELVPYHSPSLRGSGRWLRELPSVKLARAFVHDVVVRRVRSGEALLIATRQARTWNLPTHRGIVRYNGPQARAAHLSPASSGGQAILRHLTGDTWQATSTCRLTTACNRRRQERS
ncbi:MAG: hypothetical protein OJF47_003076 [Nitrospira sp.]|jgi:hypothetical protein|nr:MAG: hypothetical protein OJF47_003076 [Nitrospira sp.]